MLNFPAVFAFMGSEDLLDIQETARPVMGFYGLVWHLLASYFFQVIDNPIFKK